MDGECERVCQCMGRDSLQCSATTCGANEVCTVVDGVKGCFPSQHVTCRVYGDPHYITFDKKAYTFQGGCIYTLATTCGGHSPVQFTVSSRNQNSMKETQAKLETVTLEVQGLHVELNRSMDVYVRMDIFFLENSLSVLFIVMVN